MLIDSHVHLQDKKFSRDLERVLQRGDDAGVRRYVCISDDIASSKQALQLADRYPSLRATVGVHPHNLRRYTPEALEQVRQLAKRPSVVAIGEVGLDFHYPDYDEALQRRALTEQGLLATEFDLPLVLHCRDAYEAMIDLFKSESEIRSQGVVHCFSGTYENATELLDLGFYLGIGGAITYPNAGELRDVIRKVGLDRVVVETDAPYLPPQKKRGRRNEPSYLKFTIRAISDLFDYTYQDVAHITTANADRLYNLQEPFEPEIAYPQANRMYLNVTNRCTNKCCFCERNSNYMLRGRYLKLDGEPSAKEVLEAIGDSDHYEKYVLCGLGEPTFRLDTCLDLARELKSRGHRVGLNTNGHGSLINERNIAPEFVGLLDSVSVTMNAHDRASYNQISCPENEDVSFDAMIDFTKEIKQYVPDVRMKVLALPEVDIEACRKIAEDDLNVRFQIRAQRPNGYPELVES